ncbi:polyphosphate kinase 2 [Akkermansiaceae bacterium]|nr:polyphosphate kinase 2 [Akkermansiaceae bacterium]
MNQKSDRKSVKIPRDFLSNPPEDAERTSRAATLQALHEAGAYPYAEPMGTQKYEKTKALLQAELMKVQKWVQDDARRVVALFEGRDAAGKGGTIKRFMEHLNPRLAQVVALEKPTNYERGQWYFQRYIEHLPSRGEMAFFDRSWYNRAGVERVMGFCDKGEYKEFLRHAPLIEKVIVETGITFFKYWFSVSRMEQGRRFHARESNPLKQWKLSPVDRASLDKWDEYTAAKQAMFQHTDTPYAPWTVIKSDDKKRARINCLRHFLHSLDYPGKDKEIARKPDPKIVLPASKFYEQDSSH